jgi:hypothetical protein
MEGNGMLVTSDSRVMRSTNALDPTSLQRVKKMQRKAEDQ